eukprot:CAMPEP_0119551520 /NCGR_PEP_ID=MMETSP1352-20130426/4750_1 /TAXON_ID=265584 /ORGANISM="Stauroneis constricta, Strain CCMP1120" /LENGTH=560 /DNA_ID=CAMNT_0007597593 /DNA_START=80 /DNA_END=1762 /DNA_ORIENTATION=-
MTDGKLKILICSANVGNAEPTMESISAWVPAFGECGQVTPLTAATAKQLSSGHFDMVVIGMQESTWKKPAKMERLPSAESSVDGDNDEDSGSNSNSKPPRRKLESSPSTFNILEGKEAHDSVALISMFQETLGDDYTLIARQQRGQMRMQIWTRENITKDIEPDDIVIRCENTGIGGVLANKGGIVTTLTYQKTRITFLSAHLAAHEGEQYYIARCDNIREILRGAKTYDKYDAAISSHHMFILGDLNFRSKFGEYGELEHEEKFERAIDLIKAKDFEALYAMDELEAGIKNGDLLVNFKTLPCHFSPTFKVLREEGFVYKEQRVPSYADRILFKPADGLSRHFTPLAYEACPGFITSDHKPIRGAFTITLNAKIDEDDPSSKLISEPIRLVFSNIKCMNLPVMDVGGSSDPYVKFYWDGTGLKSDGESGLSRYSGKWPSTKMRSKELNPKWDEEIGLVVDSSIMTDTMLFLTVMDYDTASQDDLMCTLPLNAKKLIRETIKHPDQKLTIDKPLLKYGKPEGRMRFDVAIKPLSSAKDAKSTGKKKGGLFTKAKGMFGKK